MSDVSKQMIICPHCNRTSLFNIWSSINTKTDPATYSQVRDLSLFKFRCPYCEKTEIVHYPFLYHQMESAVMIYYQPKGDELAETQNMFEDVNAEAFGNPDAGQDEIQDMLKNALAGYRYRVVTTLEDFLEKLAILDAGVDDRIVELTKAMLGAQVERQLAGEGFRVKGARFVWEPETKEMKLIFFDKNSDQTASTSFDQHVANVYNQLIDRFSPALEGARKKDTVIDWNWAMELLRNGK